MCSTHRAFKDTIRVYDMLEQVTLIEWPCGCWPCDGVSLAESIPNPAEIIAEARSWRSRDRKSEYRITYGPHGPLGYGDDEREASKLAYYDAVLMWRRGRQSPGRCLFCGSVMVSLAASRYGRFEHPGCGGPFQCHLSILGGTRLIPKEVYSPEGLKLPESQVIA
ncbi:hypothetical protein ACYOEI_25415 [Singulisphaera rosea]